MKFKKKEKLGEICWQLQAKCEGWRASLVAYKFFLISYSRRPEEIETLTQELIIGVVELQIKFQPRQVCSDKAKAPVGEEWNPDIWNRDIWINAFKYLGSPDPSEYS